MALARLATEGFPVACEGDVDGALRYAVRLSGMLSGSQISLSVSQVCCQVHRFVVWLLGKFSGSQVCFQTHRCVVRVSGVLS